jgi:hypothetical protein
MLQHLVEDTTASNEIITNSSPRKLSFDNKEQLLFSIVKIFLSNMPYVTHKHLFSIKKDGSGASPKI